MNGIKQGGRTMINLLQKNANPAKPTTIQPAKNQQIATLLPKNNQQQRASYNLTAMFGLIKILISQLASPAQKEKGKTLNNAYKRSNTSVAERYTNKQGHFTQESHLSTHHHKKYKSSHNNTPEQGKDAWQTLFGIETTQIQETDKSINNQSIENLYIIEDAFEANKEKWQKSGIDDYSYTFQRSCFCTRDMTREVLTQVKNGEAIHSKFKDSGLPLPDELSFNTLSINDLFNTIENALDKHVEVIKVDYDDKTGQPTSIHIDGKTGMTDDEFSLIAKNLSST